MKKTLLSLLLIGSALTAFGWGATGHRAVGYIADRHLNKKARLAIEKILQGQPLAMTGASSVPVTVMVTVVVEPSFRLTVKVSVTT